MEMTGAAEPAENAKVSRSATREVAWIRALHRVTDWYAETMDVAGPVEPVKSDPVVSMGPV